MTVFASDRDIVVPFIYFHSVCPLSSEILSECVIILNKLFKTNQYIFHKALFGGPNFTLLQWPETHGL